MMELQNSFINNITITASPMLIDKYSNVKTNNSNSGDDLLH